MADEPITATVAAKKTENFFIFASCTTLCGSSGAMQEGSTRKRIL
jgi:hypothetical protein